MINKEENHIPPAKKIYLTRSSSHKNRNKKQILIVIFVVAMILSGTLGVSMAYAKNLVKQGDKEFKDKHYQKATETFHNAQQWWLVGLIDPKAKAALHNKILEADKLIKSAEYYEAGINAFLIKDFESSQANLSRVVKTDPHYTEAKSVLDQLADLATLTLTPNPTNSVIESDIMGAHTTNLEPRTYSIVPIGDLSGLSNADRQQMTEIYADFLSTPNLQYLTPSQQQDIFIQKASVYLDNYKWKLQQEQIQLQQEVDTLKQLNQQNQQAIPNATNPAPTAFVSPEIESAISQLNQTLTDIENQPVAMNVIEGRKQSAYRKWINENQALYTQIQSTKYIYSLNTVLAAHGMY